MIYLSLYFSFLLGLSDGGVQLWEKNNQITQNVINYTHTDMNTEFRLHYKDVAYLYLGGGINCASKQEGSLFDVAEYNPSMLDFPFGVGLRIKDKFEVGYKYQCTHPMNTYLYDGDLKYKFEGAYRVVFVKFTGDIKLW